MARGTHKSNLAASMGRWSAAHWKAATFGWLAFVVVAIAVGGALIAAWLGFHATEGLLALVTAIAGAAAGGNLALLALDIAWDRQLRDRFAANADETLRAQPATVDGEHLLPE